MDRRNGVSNARAAGTYKQNYSQYYRMDRSRDGLPEAVENFDYKML